jgi:predicted phosphate transport protein (TIGR00153 family)
VIKRNTELYVQTLFEEHINNVDETLQYMISSIESYLKDETEDARNFSYKTHLNESKADTKRRQIIEIIYTGAFLPQVQKDLIKYLAIQDKIADRAESTCDFLITQQPNIPSEFNDEILLLVQKTYQALSPLKSALSAIFTDFSKFPETSKNINVIEGEVDTMEWHLTKKIFKKEGFSLAEKQHLHELIFHLVSISDVIEDAADMLESLIVKKKI